jgi:hypothetical protein
MSACRHCGADVLWAITAKGRKMPVDPEPRPDGNLAVYRDHLGQLRCRVVTRSISGEMTMESYERPAMPHAATCPGKMPAPPKKPLPEGVASLGRARDARRRLDFAKRRGL